MVEQTLQDWVAEYATLSKEEIHTFAELQNNNVKVYSAIYTIFEEWNKYAKIIDSVCKTLFECYRSGEKELKRFVLQFLPHIIYAYLNSVAHGDKKNCRGIQMLIIGLYNLEVVNEKNQPKVISFRLPSLAQSSIYHEPMSLAPASLTESALKRLEECNTKLVKWGPLPQVERLVAQNRLQVLTALLFVYNYNISTVSKHALEQLCKVTSKMVSQGFSKHSIRTHTFQTSTLPRIPLSPQILIELIHGLYFALYNEFGYMALQSLEDIYQRASYHCFTEVLLLASAVKNTSHAAHPNGLPMGISVDLPTTAANTTTVSKSMITNASFRTKKLPDDIPIQNSQEGSGGTGDAAVGNLSSINEEKEDVGASNTPEIVPKRSLPKLAANFGKKTKEKLTSVAKSGGSGGKGNVKVPSNPVTSTLLNGGPGDNSETDESGVDIGSDMSSLTLVEIGESLDHTTPLNARKSQAGLTVDIDSARSLQVSSI